METNTNRDQQDILLEVKNLKKYFPIRTGFVKKTDLKAVDDVSFSSERVKRWESWARADAEKPRWEEPS